MRLLATALLWISLAATLVHADDEGRDWYFASLDDIDGDDDKVKDKKDNELVDLILDL